MKTIMLFILYAACLSNSLMATTFEPGFLEPDYEGWTVISADSLELAKVVFEASDEIANAINNDQIEFGEARKIQTCENLSYYVITGPLSYYTDSEARFELTILRIAKRPGSSNFIYKVFYAREIHKIDVPIPVGPCPTPPPLPPPVRLIPDEVP